MTYTELKRLEKELTSYIKKSKSAYERNDTKAENKWADKLAEVVTAINPKIVIDWPGLYPCFNLNGKDFYTVGSLLNELYEVK